MSSSVLSKTGTMPAPDGDKRALRQSLRAARRSLSPDAMTAAAHAATALLRADPLWVAARNVALYMAMPDELPTVPLIKEAWAEGKGVWLPRCLPRQPGEKGPGRMVFARCDALTDSAPGAFGIEEPLPHCPVLDPKNVLPDLLLLPAVGLDQSGTRLGYGGGYYDNLLRDPAWAAVPRIGYVFACQIVPHLPREPWDQPVHALLSEEQLIWL